LHATIVTVRQPLTYANWFMKITREEIKAKSVATRLKNLQIRAAKEKLSKRDESILKTLQAQAKATTTKSRSYR
jgi:hypothetical protein